MIENCMTTEAYRRLVNISAYLIFRDWATNKDTQEAEALVSKQTGNACLAVNHSFVTYCWEEARAKYEFRRG